MQVVCVRPFGLHEPGDVAEVPDGAAVDPWHWRPLAEDGAAEPGPDEAPETPPEPTEAPAPEVFPLTIPTEM